MHRVDLTGWRPWQREAPSLAVTRHAPVPPPRPIYKRAWFWGVISAAAAGVITAGVLASRPWAEKDTGPLKELSF